MKPNTKRRRIAKVEPPTPEIPRRLIAIDASSTAAGWSLFECGELRRVDVIRARDIPIEARADDLASRVWLAIRACNVAPNDLVVFEKTSGRHAMARPYAVAEAAFTQGVIWAATGAIRVRRERFAEADWMRGFRGDLRDKKKRAEWLAAAEPVYGEFLGSRGDPGFDGADATALGLWRMGRIGRGDGK